MLDAAQIAGEPPTLDTKLARVNVAHPAHIVVAVDSFKGTIGAAEGARVIAEAWRGIRPGDAVTLKPMADGGEGTVAAFAVAIEGAREMPVQVRGPAGLAIDASWLLLPDGTGVVELASTSGIELLGDRRLPFDADTHGFGQGICAALEHGVRRLVLGIGSSASTDGGIGLLRALGASFRDEDGVEVAPGLRGIAGISTVDLSGLARLPADGVLVLSDVTNPLLGDAGAAAVFGPQKGLAPGDIGEADRALTHLAGLMPADPTHPGAGAAGGSGFALLAWGAELVPGAHEVAELIGLRRAIAGADLVITGEGSFDVQSAHGKVPGHVAELSRGEGAPALLVAGRIAPDADLSGFADVRSLTDLAGSGEAAMGEPARWLGVAAAQLAAGLPATR